MLFPSEIVFCLLNVFSYHFYADDTRLYLRTPRSLHMDEGTSAPVQIRPDLTQHAVQLLIQAVLISFVCCR